MCLLSGAPTPYFSGSRIKAEKRRENTEERNRREKQKTDQQADKSSRSKEGPTQITGDPSSRSREEPGPLREATSEGQSILQTEIAVTISEVVNKEV
jgi:hypothetical protein